MCQQELYDVIASKWHWQYNFVMTFCAKQQIYIANLTALQPYDGNDKQRGRRDHSNETSQRLLLLLFLIYMKYIGSCLYRFASEWSPSVALLIVNGYVQLSMYSKDLLHSVKIAYVILSLPSERFMKGFTR